MRSFLNQRCGFLQEPLDGIVRAAIVLQQHSPPLQLHLSFASLEATEPARTAALDHGEVLAEWERGDCDGEALQAEPIAISEPVAEPVEFAGCWESLVSAFREEASLRRSDLAASAAGLHCPQWTRHLCLGFYEALASDKGRFHAGMADFWTSAVLLYAVLSRRLSAPDEFLLQTHLAIVDRPAALPTHRMLALMGSLEPHRLSEVLQLNRRDQPLSESTVTDSMCYARRLLAIANPSALALAEVDDPALAFVCPGSDEEGDPVSPRHTLANPMVTYEQMRELCQEPCEPCVELLPFQGPSQTSVLNHRRFCSWTDRDPELLSQDLLNGAFRAAAAASPASAADAAASSSAGASTVSTGSREGKGRKGHGHSGGNGFRRKLERLHEPLAELQCVTLQGKRLEACLSFWLNCLNAATLIAATSPLKYVGISEIPQTMGAWEELLNTAQLEVQGHVRSLAEIEDGLVRSDHLSPSSPSSPSSPLGESPPRHERILKRAVPQAIFGIHRPTSSHPVLRLFQANAVLAQLDLNAVHLLIRASVDGWRRKVLVPAFLENLELEAEGLLELMVSLLQKAPDRVAELELATGLEPQADQQLLPKTKELLKQLEALRREKAGTPFAGVRVEFSDADWAFKPPETVCHLLADARRLPKVHFAAFIEEVWFV